MKTDEDEAVVTIEDTHTNITSVVVNGEEKFIHSEKKRKGGKPGEKHSFTRIRFGSCANI